MKRVILIVVIIVLAGGGWYAYKEYNRKNKNLAEVVADITITAQALIQAFEKNPDSANKQYLGKILGVNGTIKSIEKEDNATVILGEAGNMSSVRCSMDTTQLTKIASYKEGQPIKITGACTGFNKDEFLGSDVILNRCVIN
ncbi:MAG: hypothetical protein ABR503_12655 [Chitinophagaceae bacterium]